MSNVKHFWVHHKDGCSIIRLYIYCKTGDCYKHQFVLAHVNTSGRKMATRHHVAKYQLIMPPPPVVFHDIFRHSQSPLTFILFSHPLYCHSAKHTHSLSSALFVFHQIIKVGALLEQWMKLMPRQVFFEAKNWIVSLLHSFFKLLSQMIVKWLFGTNVKIMKKIVKNC